MAEQVARATSAYRPGLSVHITVVVSVAEQVRSAWVQVQRGSYGPGRARVTQAERARGMNA